MCIIDDACAVLEQQMAYTSNIVCTSPDIAKKFCFLKLGRARREKFACLFLDNRHRLLAFEILFKGTIDSASVHPREVVRKALMHNAAAVVFAHNHPSGDPSPSQSDIQTTKKLKAALDLVEVRVLDHIIVGNTRNCHSLAENHHI